MSQISIRSAESCLCGNTIVLTASKELGKGIWGKYFAGRVPTFYCRAVCSSEKCGLLYNPDHSRFSGAYNEVVDGLSSL